MGLRHGSKCAAFLLEDSPIQIENFCPSCDHGETFRYPFQKLTLLGDNYRALKRRLPTTNLKLKAELKSDIGSYTALARYSANGGEFSGG
jgi:hypothetical protein